LNILLVRRRLTREMAIPRVKICGITCVEDALMAADLGANAVGLVFAKSPRRVSPDRATEVVRALPPFVAAVGVFVDETTEQILRIVEKCGLAAVQLHGDEGPAQAREFPGVKVIRAVRVRDESSLAGLADWDVSAFLLDTYVENARGGSGKTFNWDLARAARLPAPIILAGGLNPDNIRKAIETVRPYGVDVSSGVEAEPGRKDPGLLKRLFEEIHVLPA
jgi:phosphoribosylanthranilate isomerase